MEMEQQTKKKPMPIGVEDFRELRENYYFVDKTRFIKELWDNKGKVTLITRPRRFGKTLTLSMLQYFFTPENAEDNRKLFAGLDIERAGVEYMREQGTRPVVFLTLKDVNAAQFPDMLDLLRETLRKLYGRFRYLVHDGTSLPQDDIRFFQSILDKSAKTADMQTSLQNLMQFLEQHHGKKPILLLDEYDAPIQSAWVHGCYDDCIGFMRGFLGAALKTNPSLDFAVLTGITRISKESIFSGLNNLDVCTILNETYSDILGFTQDEVRQMCEDLGIQDKLPEIRHWYDGYRFGSTEIYNPWSVIKFIKEGQFDAYWINVSGNSILRDLLTHVDDERRSELEALLQGKPVEAAINENIVYPEIHKNRDALYTMLLTTGYLKPFRLQPIQSDSRSASRLGEFVLPNQEIRLAYNDEILNYMTNDTGITILLQLLRSMLEGDAELFRRRLQKILLEHVSMYDAAYPESFYHGMMLGFSVLMEGSYRVESNGESGCGRFDLAFFPEKENAPGVILEFKKAKSEDELEDKAREALVQIEEKDYATALKKQGVKDIWKYGIAFFGKRLWMENG